MTTGMVAPVDFGSNSRLPCPAVFLSFVLSLFLPSVFPEDFEAFLQQIQHAYALLGGVDLEVPVKIGWHFEIEGFKASRLGLLEVSYRHLYSRRRPFA